MAKQADLPGIDNRCKKNVAYASVIVDSYKGSYTSQMFAALEPSIHALFSR